MEKQVVKTRSFADFAPPPGTKSRITKEALSEFRATRERLAQDLTGEAGSAAEKSEAPSWSALRHPWDRNLPWQPATPGHGKLDLLDDSRARKAVLRSVDLNTAGFGWYSDAWYYTTGDGEMRDLWSFADVASRRLGGLIHARNWSADDYDRIYCYSESGLWYTHTPDISGRLMWSARAANSYDSNLRMLNDESGSSNCTIRQETFSVGGFLGPNSTFFNRNYRRMALEHYSGNGDSGKPGGSGSWANFGPTALSPGEIDLIGFAEGSVVAGQPVDILIGVRVELEATLDDVGILFWQGSSWNLKELWIQIDEE